MQVALEKGEYDSAKYLRTVEGMQNFVLITIKTTRVVKQPFEI